DFLLFSDDKRALHRWRAAIIAFLATRLRLVLHERECIVSPVRCGIPFLGFRVYADHRLLRRRNGVAFARRLRWLADRYARGEVDGRQVTQHVQGWVAHVAHGDTWRLRGSLLGQVHFQANQASGK
ncbi:MAG: RNA-dependent DNA polymerase, partial [Ktedonobacterales bacterium]